MCVLVVWSKKQERLRARLLVTQDRRVTSVTLHSPRRTSHTSCPANRDVTKALVLWPESVQMLVWPVRFADHSDPSLATHQSLVPKPYSYTSLCLKTETFSVDKKRANDHCKAVCLPVSGQGSCLHCSGPAVYPLGSCSVWPRDYRKKANGALVAGTQCRARNTNWKQTVTCLQLTHAFSILTLHIHGLNSPARRHRLTVRNKTQLSVVYKKALKTVRVEGWESIVNTRGLEVNKCHHPKSDKLPQPQYAPNRSVPNFIKSVPPEVKAQTNDPKPSRWFHHSTFTNTYVIWTSQ